MKINFIMYTNLGLVYTKYFNVTIIDNDKLYTLFKSSSTLKSHFSLQKESN